MKMNKLQLLSYTSVTVAYVDRLFVDILLKHARFQPISSLKTKL